MSPRVIEFSPFLLDLDDERLWRDGAVVRLRPKTFAVLRLLVEHPGRLVTKDELWSAVWKGATVTDDTLTKSIRELRSALGDDPSAPRFIETVHRRGFRWRRVVIIGGEAGIGKTTLAGLGRGRARGSIAVLPFKTLDAGDDDHHLGLALADALITKLSNIAQMIVRPTSSVRKYTDEGQDLLAVGRSLRVESVLDGNVQRSGHRIRVTVQMVNVADGTPVWAETFDQEFTDVFLLQDRVANRVAAAMTLKLTGRDKRRLAQRYTESAEAYQAYLRGRYFWSKSTEEATKKGIEYFEEATRIDPSFAMAFAGLAHCYNSLGSNGAMLGGLLPGQVYPLAKAAALRALDIDAGLGEAYASLAHVKWNYERDWVGAENDFRRSIELDPNLALTHHSHAILLAQLGKTNEATVEMHRAQELDPVSVIISTSLAWLLYWRREYDKAIEQCREALELDPRFARVYWISGLAYRKKGMHREAIAELQKAVALSGGRPAVKAALAQTHAAAGRRREARKLLSELEMLSKESFLSAYFIAAVYGELGQPDAAFTLLERAYEERSAPMINLRGDPIFDCVRSDPRFDELLDRIARNE